MEREIKEIRLEFLLPFKIHSGKTYEGERLQQLMDSIDRVGLMSPIVVRPAADGKYEIISGHNRAKAMEALGREFIRADVMYGLSDDDAVKLYYESNLNQQSFSDWSYLQKIEAIKYFEEMIRANSQQGKRTDLLYKEVEDSGKETSVQTRQKLEGNFKRATTRDKMARSLGISTATLSKFRRIIKLPDDLLKPISQLLDERKLTFEAAYIISDMRVVDIKTLLDGINRYPDKKVDLKKIKELPRRRDDDGDRLPPISRERVLESLVPKKPLTDPVPIRGRRGQHM